MPNDYLMNGIERMTSRPLKVVNGSGEYTRWARWRTVAGGQINSEEESFEGLALIGCRGLDHTKQIRLVRAHREDGDALTTYSDSTFHFLSS